MGYSKSNTQKETYSIECVHQKEGRSNINNVSFHLMKPEKEQACKSKGCRRKVRADMKENIESQ